MKLKEVLDDRGISADTISAWGVNVTDDCIEFKYPHGKKYRTVDASGKRSYNYSGTPSLYYLDAPCTPTVFLLEGETDTLCFHTQLAAQGKLDTCSVYGIPGLNGWKDEYAVLFKEAERVYVILDNDPGYRERDIADQTYRSIRESIGRAKVTRIKLPSPQSKDVCDFFKSYSWETFLALTKPRTSTYFKSLDLSKDPVPAEWLVENWIAKGDLTMMIGASNTGKSFITMGLALAVAQDQHMFLDERLMSNGKVLYIDEENSESEVLRRMTGMGLTSAGQKNIHFYHYQKIRLDKDAERVLDDALLIKPELIVIDSLTRIHSQAEDQSGAMNALFNDGIMPLARETGAAVIVIHHVGKTDSNNSFVRARGSSDLGAVIDNGIDVREIVWPHKGRDVECLNLVQYKRRNGKKIEQGMKVVIEDTLLGGIELNRLDKASGF